MKNIKLLILTVLMGFAPLNAANRSTDQVTNRIMDHLPALGAGILIGGLVVGYFADQKIRYLDRKVTTLSIFITEQDEATRIIIPEPSSNNESATTADGRRSGPVASGRTYQQYPSLPNPSSPSFRSVEE